ncbi:hypothetical protein [Methanoculleus sp.]|jgi:hypothetical protein|nr:hypothetical protein [Methanoculleus sp.]
MNIRKLLCPSCALKVRTAEAIYQKQRREKIKKLNKKKSETTTK